MDSIGSITESEEPDELLMVLEASLGRGVSEITSKGSAECGGFEGTATVLEVQWRPSRIVLGGWPWVTWVQSWLL